MTDKKKQNPRADKPEMDMYDIEIPEMEMLMQGAKCPAIQGCPMICPMMCPMMSGQMMEPEDMRGPYWYDEEDSDYISDESDDYPGHWKQKKKQKYPPYPVFWPPYYPVKPYKKKHRKW